MIDYDSSRHELKVPVINLATEGLARLLCMCCVCMGVEGASVNACVCMSFGTEFEEYLEHGQRHLKPILYQYHCN
jgi:hypothetical protein